MGENQNVPPTHHIGEPNPLDASGRKMKKEEDPLEVSSAGPVDGGGEVSQLPQPGR